MTSGEGRKAAGRARAAGPPRDLIALYGLALLLFAALSFARALFNDGDTSWHLAAGRLILDGRAIPSVDPFSFTFAGAPWTAHEWLAEVLMAGALRAAGWPGLALLTAAAVTALMLTVALFLRRRLPMAQVVIVLVLLFIVITPSILARPHVLAWALLALWTVILLRARHAGRAPGLAAALLMLVWANLHGSFVFGLVLLGLFGLEALVFRTDRRRQLSGWGLFGFVSLLLALATPHGAAGLLFPLQVSGMESLPLIREWRPTSLAEDTMFLLVLGGVALLLAVKRVRIPVFRLLLLLLLVFLALQHVRHQAVLAIVASLVLAEPLARARTEVDQSKKPRPGGLLLTALLVLGLAAIAAVRLAVPMERQSSGSNPLEAIAAVPPDLWARPVLNSYGFGGPLILAGIRPYIDGRADMYGDAFLVGHQAIVNGDRAAFDRAVARWGIVWTILEPGAPLVRALDADPRWRRVYADRWAVVHVAVRPRPRRD